MDDTIDVVAAELEDEAGIVRLREDVMREVDGRVDHALDAAMTNLRIELVDVEYLIWIDLLAEMNIR